MINQSGTTVNRSYSLSYSAISDTGLVRAHNEDLYLILEDEFIFCVADGAGGQGKGDLASYLTIKGIKDVVKGTDDKAFDDTIPLGDETIALPIISEKIPLDINKDNSTILLPAIHHANELCWNSEIHNMASTIVSYHFDNEQLHIVHVGDSRAYCFQNNTLQRLTKDHSLVNYLFDKGEITQEEIENHPKKNVILRAVGAEENIEITSTTLEINNGALYILCSDGLTSMISDTKIASLMSINSNNLELLCTSLVNEAKKNGGRDNITIIIIKVEQ